MSGDNTLVAATPTTALPSGSESYDPVDLYDEAFAAAGVPREHYADLLAGLAGADLDAAVRRLRRELVAEDCTFGADEDAEAFPIDLIPRVITADEWAGLSAGLEQRVRALDAFIADVYAEQR